MRLRIQATFEKNVSMKPLDEVLFIVVKFVKLPLVAPKFVAKKLVEVLLLEVRFPTNPVVVVEFPTTRLRIEAKLAISESMKLLLLVLLFVTRLVAVALFAVILFVTTVVA